MFHSSAIINSKQFVLCGEILLELVAWLAVVLAEVGHLQFGGHIDEPLPGDTDVLRGLLGHVDNADRLPYAGSVVLFLDADDQSVRARRQSSIDRSEKRFVPHHLW